jgi:hypothetical protein
MVRKGGGSVLVEADGLRVLRRGEAVIIEAALGTIGHVTRSRGC